MHPRWSGSGMGGGLECGQRQGPREWKMDRAGLCPEHGENQGGSSWPRAGGRPPPQSRGTDTGGACGQRWAGGLAGTWKGLACRLYQEQVHSQALPDPLLGQKRDCRASPFHPDPAITGAPAHCHPSAGRWEAGSGGPGTSSDQEVRGPPQEPESSRHAASGLKAQALRVTDNQINQAQFPGKERPLRPA